MEPTDDDRSISPGEQIAAGLVDMMGGDPEDLHSAMDDLFGTQRARATSGSVAAGLTLGVDLAERRRQLREHGDVEPPDEVRTYAPDEPLADLREIEDEAGEFAGVRVLCSDPGAGITVTDQVIVLTSGTDVIEHWPLGFPAGAVSVEDVANDSSISEWVIEPEAADVDVPDDPGPDVCDTCGEPEDAHDEHGRCPDHPDYGEEPDPPEPGEGAEDDDQDDADVDGDDE